MIDFNTTNAGKSQKAYTGGNTLPSLVLMQIASK